MNTEEYYKGKRSLYHYCYAWGLNAYEFDILKRVTRRKKGQERQDLKKSLNVLDIYCRELLKHGQLSAAKPEIMEDSYDYTVDIFVKEKGLSKDEEKILSLVLSIRRDYGDYLTKVRDLWSIITSMINELDN